MKTELRKIRESTGRSMASVALELGMSPAHFSLIERGTRPTKATARKIIEGLNRILEDIPGGVHITNPTDVFEDFGSLREG